MPSMKSIFAAAAVFALAIWQPTTATAYVLEYVNCPNANCAIPDMKVGGALTGVVDGECTNFSLPTIKMNCYYKNVPKSTGCNYVKKSTSEMTCSCPNNDAVFTQTLKGAVSCSP